MMRFACSLAVAGLVLDLACCRAPVPAATASPSSADTTTPAVDLNSESCREVTPGRLFGRGGALWFETRPDDPLLGQSWTEEREEPTDPGSFDRNARYDWIGGDTLLTTARGTWSTVVPTASGRAGWVVRRDVERMVFPDEGEPRAPGPDALGLVTMLDVDFRPVWTPGDHLYIVGRVGALAVVAFDSRDGFLRLASVAEDGTVVARSEPLGPADDFRLVLPELGLPYSAPLGSDRLVQVCGDALCVARIGTTDITVERAAFAGAFLAMVGGELIVVRREGVNPPECRKPGDAAPADWPALPAEACPDEAPYQNDYELGLPADGLLVNGFSGEATACRVRDRVQLPALEDPDDAEAQRRDEYDWNTPPGAGIVVLSDVQYSQTRLQLDLLARGTELALGFTFLDGLGAPTVRRDFGVSLPPGSVEAVPLVVGGDRAMYRVRIDVPLPFPFVYDGDCWLGRLVLRAAWDGETGDEQAFADRYWEFGVCE